MRTAKTLLGMVALGLGASAASGQVTNDPPLGVLIRQGDTIIGMGGMNQTVNWVGINDTKNWGVLCVTDFSDVNKDGCLLLNGFVAVREGTFLLDPASSTLDDWIAVHMNSNGDLGMLIRTKPTVGSITKDGAFFNLTRVAMRDDFVPSPFFAPNPSADWDTFAVIRLNARNQMFILGEIANPNLSRARERSLVRYDLDSTGHILSTTLLASEGMTIPTGLRLSGATCLPNTETGLNVNNRGDVITIVQQDNVGQVVVNMSRIVARTDRNDPPSPVPGKPWRSFAQSHVGINDFGDTAMSGTIGDAAAPDGYLIMVNGKKFAQSTDFIPSLGGTIGPGSQAPLLIGNNRDVFWHARGGPPTPAPDAFMHNLDPIVRVGLTQIDGQLVTQIAATDTAFAISPNGRFWVGNVTLQSDGTAIVFADFGLLMEIPACFNTGKLTHATGSARVGKEFQLALDNGQAPGAVPTLFFSRNSRLNANGCGTVIQPYGEIMVRPPIFGLKALTPWDGTNPSVSDPIRIPATKIALVDSVFFAQGLFFSPGSLEKYRMTNLMRIEIGAP